MNTPKQFQRKRVTIEAMQWIGDNGERDAAVINWILSREPNTKTQSVHANKENMFILVSDNESLATLPGDWVVLSTDGKFSSLGSKNLESEFELADK